MIAYKFLRSDGTGVFTQFPWPLPDGAPGAWVEAPIDTCRSGIHACRARDLPLWLGRELYEIELDGEVVAERTKIVAERGRLLRRLDAWDDRARADYVRACADRAHSYAEGLPEWATAIEPSVANGPASIGFITARIAEARQGLDGYHAERALQVAWLTERLQLVR